MALLQHLLSICGDYSILFQVRKVHFDVELCQEFVVLVKKGIFHKPENTSD